MALASVKIFVLLAVAALLASCATVPDRAAVRPPLPSPGEYLARGMAEFDAADALRRERSSNPVMGGVFGGSRDYEAWSQHLGNAEADFRAILDRFPANPEAPEAQFMLGRINDHPQRNRFDDAVAEYRLTVERYPESAAAGKARKRIELIESIK